MGNQPGGRSGLSGESPPTNPDTALNPLDPPNPPQENVDPRWWAERHRQRSAVLRTEAKALASEALRDCMEEALWHAHQAERLEALAAEGSPQ